MRPIILALSIIAAGAVLPEGQTLKWYKGNTHTHTINSDGDATPADVVRWYRDQRYNFLVLTDHDSLTSVEGLNAVYAAAEPPVPARRPVVPVTPFLLIPGEEVTDQMGAKALHLTAINVRRAVPPQGGTGVSEILQRNGDAIRAESGMPLINHPNFQWSLTPADLKGLRNVKFMEIYNGHPLVNNLGGGGRPGAEQIWDEVLSGGQLLWGVAADDSHHFQRPWFTAGAQPGRGWVMVRAERLTPEAILAALDRGDFYSSTGVELSDYKVTGKSITLAMAEARRTATYRTLFIGKDGRVLKEVSSNPAGYEFQGDELYVRAKVIESNGQVAWTQPVMRQ